MSTRFSYSVHVKCPDPEGQKCPLLWRADGKTWTGRHGSAGWAARIPTSKGTKLVRRFGHGSKAGADAEARHAGKLLELAGADTTTRAKVGDLIAAAKRGQPLPSVEDVRRRLSLGQDPASSGVTFGEAWGAWLAGNKRLRRSSRRRLEQIAAHWLLPVLADVPLERLNGSHCVAVFDRIEAINAEITAQQAEGRALIKAEGDDRERPSVLGVASQHRVFAALRTVLNFEVKVTHRLVFNPVYAVRLEAEETPEAEHWTAAQAHQFLAATADDELGLMWRVAVLCGPRRGELIGFRWSASDLDAGYLGVSKTVLQLGGETVFEDKAKTRESRRRVWLDAKTAQLLREHRVSQDAERMLAGDAWQDHDLVFARPDGRPWPPDLVSRRFKSAAKAANVPVVKLHEGGRHSAATLAHEAMVDPEIRQRNLGHASAEMTSHYTHPEAAAHRAAAEAVAKLVEGDG